MLAILALFAWALRGGQFDDLEREGERILETPLDADQASIRCAAGTIAAHCTAAIDEEVIDELSRPQPAVSRSIRDDPVRWFALAAVLWGVVGMLVGVIIAAQLTWPELNFGIPWLSYGRLRPLHTNAVIFAFGGCALFATSYHVVQRTCQTRLFAPGAGDVHVLGLAAGDRAGRASRCRWA